MADTQAETTEKNKRVSRSTLAVMGCTLLSRLLGFIKIVIIGAVFGASGKADVLNAVFAVPNNLRKLMAEGALSSSFIPVLSASVAQGDEHSVTRKIVRNIMAFQMVVLIPVCILSIIFADFLINDILLDFENPELQLLAVDLFRCFISYILLISICAVIMAVLNVHGFFTVPALTPILFSIAVIVSILTLHRSMGVFSMAVGVIAGGILQILFQYPRYRKLDYDMKLSFDFSNEKFRKIMINWLPIVATSSIFAINQQISMRFASGLDTGSSSAISYALVFWQLPYGIFAAAITTVLFPKMSREAASGQGDLAVETMTTGIVSLMALLIPSSVIMYFLGYDIISIGMQRGSFTADDTALAGYVLQGYAFGLLGTGIFNFVQRYYYAVNNYKKPFFFAVLCAALDVVLSLWLKETPLRAAGLAWANTISFTVGSLLMLADIRLSTRKLPVFRLARELVLVSLAMVGGVIPLMVFGHYCGDWWKTGVSIPYFGAFMAVVAVFSAVVLTLYKLFGLNTVFMLRKRS